MIYPLIIIGSGPGGLTASIYASRYRIKHLMIGKQLGGMMALASAVENYPGFKRISGLELAEKMAKQARFLGAEIISDEVLEIENKNSSSSKPEFKIITASGKTYKAKAIILATGTKRRELGVPGEKEFLGRGVSYCATCDAAFFENKLVAVIGGANAAVMSADHLARFAKKVYLIYRGKPLRAEPIWRERVEENPKIEIVYNTNVVKILGKEKVEGVELDNPYQGLKILPLDGVFIEIGGVPTGELVRKLGVELDEGGFIRVNPQMETNVRGVFAAGDIANLHGELQQIIIACAEGAIAATSVYKFLRESR